MKNYYLGSVGNAELFKKVGGKLTHFASAKTLTDSSINLSVSAEEVRGGQGAQLLGQFFHTSNFGLTLTDSMFHLEYIAAQVGGEIIDGGYGMVDEQIEIGANGVAPALKELPIRCLKVRILSSGTMLLATVSTLRLKLFLAQMVRCLRVSF